MAGGEREGGEGREKTRAVRNRTGGSIGNGYGRSADATVMALFSFREERCNLGGSDPVIVSGLFWVRVSGREHRTNRLQ